MSAAMAITSEKKSGGESNIWPAFYELALSAAPAHASLAQAVPATRHDGSETAQQAVRRFVSTSHRWVRPGPPIPPGGGSSAYAGAGPKSPPRCVAVP